MKRHNPTDGEEKPMEGIRLNRFIAASGVCSRRGAEKFIIEGQVVVNGKVVIDLAYKVRKFDKVYVNGKSIRPEKLQYILLNKPKDFICTKKDTHERKIVMSLLPEELQHLNPVGRLDRKTTGVLLFTNDGELTQKLLHPSKKIKKVYKLSLDRLLTNEEFDKLLKGIELEDGPSAFDKLIELNTELPGVYGVEIHSGKNRVIRRMMEAIRANVLQLDRVMFHTIDKQGLKRGDWRHLNEKELHSLGIKPFSLKKADQKNPNFKSSRNTR